MFIRVRSSAAVGTILAVAVVLGSVPASADPATLYSATPAQRMGPRRHRRTAWRSSATRSTSVAASPTPSLQPVASPRQPHGAATLDTATSSSTTELQRLRTNGTVRASCRTAAVPLHRRRLHDGNNDQPRNRVAKLDLAGNLVTGFDVTANNVGARPPRGRRARCTWSATSPRSTASPASGRPPSTGNGSVDHLQPQPVQQDVRRGHQPDAGNRVYVGRQLHHRRRGGPQLPRRRSIPRAAAC